ncbi:MAG: dihydropteroate synthase [Candidatus Melainabacteria bacterium]|nr:MAG: dihydropteroate synthase [Candidatus Melainabacteria bacterium]
MKNFYIKTISKNIDEELEQIGFDRSYIGKGKWKFEYKNLKIFDLNIPQANILKQTAISVGADCAVHKNIVTAKIDKTDCILGGSFSQLKKISEKLKYQPFKLKLLGEEIEQIIFNKFTPIQLKDTIFDFSRPYIVGILNLGQSFSDGYPDIEEAKKHLNEMIEDGADMIDIGAESTRPYSSPVSEKEQLKKIVPILEYINSNDIRIPISIDTRSSKVADICLGLNADMINDVSGLDYDKEMINVLVKHDAPVIIQHSSATPDVMQNYTNYDNLVEDILKSLIEKANFAQEQGLSSIIIDVGIGFGKTIKQNLELLDRIEEFSIFPQMVGISRKSFLQAETLEQKDILTLALNSSLIDKGVNFLRVHNVKLHKDLFDLKVFKK